MPRLTTDELAGYDIGFKTVQRPVTDENGNLTHDAQGVPLELVDAAQGHRIVYGMPIEAKAVLIEGLTGGITVPTIHVPNVR